MRSLPSAHSLLLRSVPVLEGGILTDRAKPLPRQRESADEPRAELTETAKVELRGATARATGSSALRVRLDFAAFSQLQLELLPPEYYFG